MLNSLEGSFSMKLLLLKKIFASIILFFMFTMALPMSQMLAADLLIVDPMEAVYPDVRPPALGVALAAPLGGTMLVQVVLSGEPEKLQVKNIELLEDGKLLTGAQWFALDFVPVEQNTGVSCGTEIRDGKKNPHVIRRAPFEIADAMAPVGVNWDSAAWNFRSAGFNRRGCAAFAVRWPVNVDTRPGRHDYTVTAKLKDGQVFSSSFATQVYAVKVPPPELGTFNLVQTSRTRPIANAYKVPFWSDEFWNLYGNYARTLVEGRQSTGRLLLPEMAVDCPTGTEPQFSERLDRMIKVLKKAGMRNFLGVGIFHPVLPKTPGKPQWGVNSYKSPVFGTPEGDAKARALFAQIRRVTEANGLSGKFKMQVFDEVPESDNALYVRAAKMLREEIPGVKIYEVINSPNLGIADSVDEWCPMANVYEFRREFFEQRKAAGQQVSIYTCMGPGGAWVNRLLDQERTRIVSIPWFVYGYGLSGYLHWGANSWISDPFKQSVVFTGSGDPKKNFLPAGDTHILYPGDTGPWISLRFEAQRLGAEDYEVLALLGKNDAKAARELVFKHFPKMNNFSRDTASYWQARHNLLAAGSKK